VSRGLLRAQRTQHALTTTEPLPDGELLLVLALVVPATAALGLVALALIAASGGTG
jgi:hypothetical protein